MRFNYKDIHIGNLLQKAVLEKEITTEQICIFLNVSESKLHEIFQSKSLDTELLLRWSKLLEYDFFRIYSQHLQLYSPLPSVRNKKREANKTNLPQFRKNLYTTEIIEFIIELIEKGQMKKSEIIATYNIPKTTLYKWIEKHQK